MLEVIHKITCSMYTYSTALIKLHMYIFQSSYTQHRMNYSGLSRTSSKKFKDWLQQTELKILSEKNALAKNQTYIQLISLWCRLKLIKDVN